MPPIVPPGTKTTQNSRMSEEFHADHYEIPQIGYIPPIHALSHTVPILLSFLQYRTLQSKYLDYAIVRLPQSPSSDFYSE